MTDVIIVLIQAAYSLLMIKILSRKLYINISDCFFVLIVGVSGGLLLSHIGLLAALILVGFLCYYSYKVSKYSLKKSVFLSTLIMVIAIVFEHSASLILQQIFGETSFVNEYLLFIHVAISAVLSVFFTYLFTKATKKIRIRINANEQLQFLLASISALMLLSFYGTIVLSMYLGSGIELIQLNFIFLIIYLIIGLIIFYLYSKTIHEKFALQRSKDEQENLRKYTQEIETHYTDMRKFKHDYQNILASLDDYIRNEDFQGLKHYYLEKIKPASAMMDQHQFVLEPLSKIQIREVKSILALKLMEAQMLNIDASFEARDEVNNLPLDSIVLVRSLGILLDNAIEELTTLGNGLLKVGVLKDENSTMFVIQNTCRDDIERVHLLKQAGFSTKGKGRGMGLNNLAGFAKEHPNMRIETSIVENQFIQKIIVGG